MNVCLELNALGNSEKIFFIETLMVWIHHCRMLEGDRETFKHCLIIEEAHNILSASTKETVVDILLREIRELGEAIVLVDQHPSQMSVPAIGNTYTTIALNAKHSKDLACLGDIMQVPRESRELFSQLPMGRAVVKLQSRYTRPFQIQIPKVDLDKGSVTDADLMQLYPADYADSDQESDQLAQSQESQVIPAGRKEDTSEEESLGEIERLLLKDVYDHPLEGVVKRYGRIGVSRRRGNHAKESLIAEGLIRSVDVPTKTGKVVLLEITPDIKVRLKEKGVQFPSFREGGVTHAYWTRELGKAFELRGWIVKAEKPIGGGKSVDLHAEHNGFAVAVEVETGDRGCENIMKLLPVTYEWILSFSVTEAVKSRTREDIRRQDIHSNHVLFATPADYENKVDFLSRDRAAREERGHSSEQPAD
jgi:hypothetical protein